MWDFSFVGFQQNVPPQDRTGSITWVIKHEEGKHTKLARGQLCSHVVAVSVTSPGVLVRYRSSLMGCLTGSVLQNTNITAARRHAGEEYLERRQNLLIKEFLPGPVEQHPLCHLSADLSQQEHWSTGPPGPPALTLTGGKPTVPSSSQGLEHTEETVKLRNSKIQNISQPNKHL